MLMANVGVLENYIKDIAVKYLSSCHSMLPYQNNDAIFEES